MVLQLLLRPPGQPTAIYFFYKVARIQQQSYICQIRHSRTFIAKKTILQQFNKLDLYCGLARKSIKIYTTISIGKCTLQLTGRRGYNHCRNESASATAVLSAWQMEGKERRENARNHLYFCFTRRGCWVLAYNEKLSRRYEVHDFPHHCPEHLQAVSEKQEAWGSQNASCSPGYAFLPTHSNALYAVLFWYGYL